MKTSPQAAGRISAGETKPQPLSAPRAKDTPHYSFRNLLNPEGEKSCSLQARGFGGTCPSSPPPRPPAAAQRAPRCSRAARSSSGTEPGPAVLHASAAGSAGGRRWSRVEIGCWHLRAQLHTRYPIWAHDQETRAGNNVKTLTVRVVPQA